MPSKAVVLVVASLLLAILIYSSVAQFDVFALHKVGTPNCSQIAKSTSLTTLTNIECCWTESDQFSSTSPEENVHVYCQNCYYNNDGSLYGCDPVKTIVRTSGQTGILGTTRILTNALPPSGNKTGTPPLGGIIKVPPAATNALPPSGNSTGTPPTLTITKEHNPASPNVFNLAKNTTNPNNNTSTLKLSPLTQQTTGQHHHKGSNLGSSTSSGNSTGH
jgi:hypothetical protein